MANVEHSTLSGSNLHENKGVATATNNTVATAVGGATVWSKLTHSNLTTTGNPFGAQLFHLQHTASTGSAGGTASSGAFRTRPLTDVLTNEITGASVASNVVTLPAGTYRFDGYAILAMTATDGGTSYYGKHRLQNTSSSTTLGHSSPLWVYNTASQGPTFFSGTFTLASTSTIELQYYISVTQIGGLGQPSSASPEVYADLKFWKIA